MLNHLRRPRLSGSRPVVPAPKRRGRREGERQAFMVARASENRNELNGTMEPMNSLSDNSLAGAMEATMPVILWLLGVPLIVVIALMVVHVI